MEFWSGGTDVIRQYPIGHQVFSFSTAIPSYLRWPHHINGYEILKVFNLDCFKKGCLHDCKPLDFVQSINVYSQLKLCLYVWRWLGENYTWAAAVNLSNLILFLIFSLNSNELHQNASIVYKLSVCIQVMSINHATSHFAFKYYTIYLHL